MLYYSRFSANHVSIDRHPANRAPTILPVRRAILLRAAPVGCRNRQPCLDHCTLQSHSRSRCTLARVALPSPTSAPVVFGPTRPPSYGLDLVSLIPVATGAGTHLAAPVAPGPTRAAIQRVDLLTVTQIAHHSARPLVGKTSSSNRAEKRSSKSRETCPESRQRHPRRFYHQIHQEKIHVWNTFQ